MTKRRVSPQCVWATPSPVYGGGLGWGSNENIPSKLSSFVSMIL